MRFVTSFDRGPIPPCNEMAWREVWDQASDLRETLRAEGRSDDADLVFDRISPPRDPSSGLAGIIAHPLGVSDESAELVLVGRQVHEPLFELPPIFLFCLSLHSQSQLVPLCESLPFVSLEEATLFFEACVNHKDVRRIASAIGDSVSTRAFALCALPEASKGLRDKPTPTSDEVKLAAKELAEAITSFAEVIERWQGEDAYRHLIERRDGRMRLSIFYPTELARLKALPDQFNLALRNLGDLPRRAGRKVRGGKEHAGAVLIEALWRRCAVPWRVSFSGSSKFMKACNLILPMYDIQKADYSQFMRAELAKRRVRGVVIGS